MEIIKSEEDFYAKPFTFKKQTKEEIKEYNKKYIRKKIQG